MLEFALTGVPMMFVWLSTIQMSIGMWHYHTLQYAAKETSAYISTHGSSYVVAHTSGAKVQDIATVLHNAAVGIPTREITLTLTAYKADGTTTSTRTCALNECMTDATVWPPSQYNSPGNWTELKADYIWRSGIAMVAPGAGARAVSFGAFHIPGHSKTPIVF